MPFFATLVPRLGPGNFYRLRYFFDQKRRDTFRPEGPQSNRNTASYDLVYQLHFLMLSEGMEKKRAHFGRTLSSDFRGEGSAQPNQQED